MSASLDLDEALELVLKEIPTPAEVERVGLNQALGRVVAEDCRACIDLPPFPASAMDGYAFKWRPQIEPLRIVGASVAGHPYHGPINAGEAVRITTGAAMPTGCDTVALQEDCILLGDRVRINCTGQPGDNVRPRAQDIRCGQPVVQRGRSLNAFDIGALAASGADAVTAFNRPRIAVFSSGDELKQPGAALEYGDIYDSNRYAVASLLRKLPVEVINLGVLKDDAILIAEGLVQASQDCQLILTSGGVSVGEADLVKSAIESLGELRFWRLNLKPGKPLAFGRIGRASLLGLPGNPVSTIVTYLLLAKPAVEALCGMQPQPPLRVRCKLTERIRHKPGREEYQRGLMTEASGVAEVRITGDQSSNRMSTFAAANCLIRIPKTVGDLAPGSSVQALPFWGLA